MDIILSIVTPCFNDGRFLDEMLESVHTYHWPFEIEHIIVNDGSTDPFTIEKLEEIKTSFNVKVINQQNFGLGKARNTGINFSKGKYILPLDCDNKIHFQNILNALAFFETLPSNVAVVYGNAEFFGDKMGAWIVGDFDKNRLLKNNYIDACALINKKALVEVGGYKENMPYMGWEDWELWLNLIEHGFEFSYVDYTLFYYRVSGSSMIHGLIKDNLKIEILKAYIYYHHINLYNLDNDPLKLLTESYENKIRLIINSNSYKLGNRIINIIRPFLKKFK